MATIVQIQLRRDTAADWTANNPILAEGEPGYETDTTKIKYGDGVTAWNSLAYWNDESEELTLVTAENINADRAVVNIGGLAYNFDPTDLSHYRKVVGISRNSVTTGQPVKILVNEQIATGLTLTAGAIYFGDTAGQLTTTAPTSGISQPLGVAIDATKLLIQIQTPIIKA